MRKETTSEPRTSCAPLSGIRVIDFSTLLPGPLCGLLLGQAGAEVIKVERPGRGDEMRTYVPKFGGDSVNFALLNQNKRSVSLDLKDPGGLREAIDLVSTADVLVEQFRPGVMDRLGLGYEAMRIRNPKLIYCSITGWGQDGPMAGMASHDLNYQAEAGLLALTAGVDGSPGVPHALVADIAGGAYPAMMNILLALRARDFTGEGCFIDVSMADNLFTFMYWGLGEGFAAGNWPTPGSALVTGGTPRHHIYCTRDGRYLAAAPLEQKFWVNFLQVLEAPHLLDDSIEPNKTREAVASIIATRTADEWMLRFAAVDACVSIVRSLQEAVQSPHFRARGLFDSQIESGDGAKIPALPLPISASFKRQDSKGCPELGEGNDDLLSKNVDENSS